MARNIYLIFILFATLVQPGNIFAREYVVGGDSDYAPFSFIDKNGKPNGMDIDVLKAIAVSSDIKVNFQLSRWDSALSYIQSGETDIITGIIFSEERAKFLDFTIPIHTEYYSIFIRKNLPYQDLSSLYNYKPVVLDKDVSIDKYLIPMGLFKNHVLAKSLPEALSVIELGLADYVVAPNLLGLNVIKNNKYHNIEIKGPSIIPSMYCMAVKKGNTQLLNILNNGISELRRNGKLTEIQEKWNVYEQDDFKYKRTAKIIGIVFIFAILLLILVFIWVWVLRLQIKKQTESIHLKNQELQKSEEKYRIITENSSDIIWHLDNNFLLTYISPADERIRGFKREEVMGTSLFSILKPEGIELLMEANKRRMTDLSNGIRSAPAIYELEELCKDGSWVWVEATATAFYDRDGKISGYHGVSRDISERKKAEEQLKDSEARLREMNATKDKFFSIISHDLRGAFSSILSLTDLMNDNSFNFSVDELHKFIQSIHKTTESTFDLLQNLLEWARLQQDAMPFVPELLNISNFIGNCDVSVHLAAEKKLIGLNINIPEGLTLLADPNMLRTIMQNLVMNAIKFTKQEGEVAIEAQLSGEDSVLFSVKDNGIGMSKQILENLFRIDVNVSRPGTDMEPSTGLGLILCKEFVDKHSCKIWAESEVGNGTTFYFTIPCIR